MSILNRLFHWPSGERYDLSADEVVELDRLVSVGKFESTKHPSEDDIVRCEQYRVEYGFNGGLEALLKQLGFRE